MRVCGECKYWALAMYMAMVLNVGVCAGLRYETTRIKFCNKSSKYNC